MTLRNAVIPYLSYAFIIGVYWIVFPQLLKVLSKLPFLYTYISFFLAFPFIDTLLILFNWLMQYAVNEDMKLFVSTANNWLLQGYRVGIILLANFSEVEFYYMLFFMVFRNIFFNFVVKKSKSDRMNVSMTGWIFAFYAGYVLNFYPVCGIMNIVVSKYYSAYLHWIYPTLYNTNPYVSSLSFPITGINIFFKGNIAWFSPLMLWAGSTFTQKYHLYKFNWKLLFYNFLGIFLFYEGLVSALAIVTLYTNAPF